MHGVTIVCIGARAHFASARSPRVLGCVTSSAIVSCRRVEEPSALACQWLCDRPAPSEHNGLHGILIRSTPRGLVQAIVFWSDHSQHPMSVDMLVEWLMLQIEPCPGPRMQDAGEGYKEHVSHADENRSAVTEIKASEAQRLKRLHATMQCAASQRSNLLWLHEKCCHALYDSSLRRL